MTFRFVTVLEKITGIPCISGIVAALDVYLAHSKQQTLNTFTNESMTAKA